MSAVRPTNANGSVSGATARASSRPSPIFVTWTSIRRRKPSIPSESVTALRVRYCFSAVSSASRLIDTSRIAEKASGTIDTTTRVAIRAVTIRSRGRRGIGITRGF